MYIRTMGRIALILLRAERLQAFLKKSRETVSMGFSFLFLFSFISYRRMKRIRIFQISLFSRIERPIGRNPRDLRIPWLLARSCQLFDLKRSDGVPIKLVLLDLLPYFASWLHSNVLVRCETFNRKIHFLICSIWYRVNNKKIIKRCIYLETEQFYHYI